MTEPLKEFTKPLTLFLSTSKNRLSSELVDRAKLLLLDYLGAYLAGQKTQPSQVLVALMGEPLVKNSLWAANSAFQYGVAAHALELDDAHRYACVHPGSIVFSTGLALGGALHSSGQDLLLAAIVGYEAMCRVAHGLDLPEHYKKGFHPTGTCGPFGATATAAKLLRLNSKQWESAFGIAGSIASGSMQFLLDGAWTKPLHSGWAAHNGIQASILARNGFRGPSRVLEGPYGFWRSHGEAEDKSLVLEGLGKRYEILRTTVKRYPCCGHTQSTISALVELIKERGVKADAIKELEIRLPKFAMLSVAEPEPLKRHPKTAEDGMWSIFYGAAVTLLRENLSLEAYERKFLKSPKIRSIMGKIRVLPEPSLEGLFPERWPSIVAITMRTGERWVKRVDHPRGDPENFLSWEEICEKFSELSDRLLTEKRKKAIIEHVQHLEKVRDVSSIIKLFRLPKR